MRFLLLMKITKANFAMLALIFANMIWGAAAPIFKWTLQGNIQPFTFAFLRFTLAALILFPFAAHRLKIHKKDLPFLLFTGAIGMGFQIAYLFMGLRLTASINAPIISSAAPVFLILGSILFLHEKPKKKVLRGTFISLLGVALIILRPIFEHGLDSSILGNLFFIVSMILSVIYTLLLKEIAARYNPITLTFWIFAIAAMTLSPLVLYEVGKGQVLFVPDARTALGVLFGGVVVSAGGYLLYSFGIKHIAASETGIFSYVDPVVALLIAKPLLGESLTTTFTIGAALVFLGIFISEGRIHYHPIHLLFRKRQPQFTVPPALAPTILRQMEHYKHDV